VEIYAQNIPIFTNISVCLIGKESMRLFEILEGILSFLNTIARKKIGTIMTTLRPKIPFLQTLFIEIRETND
jgi:hypothetical protein